MRTLNPRFAAGFLLVLVLLGTGVYFLHRHQFVRIAADLRAQIDDARQADRTDDAINLTYQYLEFSPDDVGMLEQLAGWLEQKPGGKKHLAGVAGLLDHALQIDPNRSDLRRRLVALNLKRRQWGECLGHIERLLAETPGDAELQANLGVCQEAIGQAHAAAESFEKALKLDPKRVTTSLDYAACLHRHLHRPDDARKILDDTIQQNPDHVEARLSLARLLKATGKATEASTAAKEAVRLAPENLNALLTAAEIEQSAGKYSAARGYYELARKISPNNAQLACSLAWLLLCEGKSTEAAAELEAVLKERPDHADALTLLGDILALDGKMEALAQVAANLDKLRQSDPTRAWNADYLLARLAMQRHDYAAAANRLEILRMSSVKRPGLAKQANYLLAQCYEQLHDRSKELEAYRRALDGDGQSGYFRLEFARALARGNDFAAAVAEVRAAVQRSDAPVRMVIEVVGDLTDRTARFGGTASIKDLERTWEPIRGDDANIHLVLAKVELLRKQLRTQQAITLMECFVAAHPNHVEGQVLWVQLLDDAMGRDRAATALADAEKRLGDRAEFRVARLRLFAGRDGVSPDVMFTAASGLERFNPEDRFRVLSELAATVGTSGDAALMRQALELQRASRADLTPARFTLALSADQAAASLLMSEIAAIEGPQSKTEQLLGVCRQLQQGDADGALTRLKEASVFGGDALALFFRGRAEEMLGQPSAKQSYVEAINAGLLDILAECLFASTTGDQDVAKTRIFIEESPLFDRLRLGADRAMIRSLLSMTPASTRPPLVDRLLRANPMATAPELVWLGKLLQAHGISRGAEASFVRATQIAPLSDEAWTARLLYHQAKNDTAKMQELVVHVKRTLPPERAAVALIAAGLPHEAPSVVRQAVATNAGSVRQKIEQLMQAGRLIEARELLPAIIEKDTTTADDKAWARRSLALSLTMEPSLSAFQKSLGLLAANPGDDEDKRAIASVYAAQRTRVLENGLTARAIARQTLAVLREPKAEDLILAARLARTDRDQMQYRQIVTRLSQTHRDQPGVLQFLAREAIRTGDPASSDYLTALAGRSDRFARVAIVAIAQAVRGDAAAAVKTLDDAIQTQPSPGLQIRCAHVGFDILHGWPMGSSAAAAEVMREATIRWYKAALGKDPQALLHLVMLLGEADRLGEAIDLLQSPSVSTQFSKEAQAAAFVTVLRRSTPTNAQKSAVERMLNGLVQKQPNSQAIQLALADLYEQTGRTSQAIGIYRAVLERDPGNMVAANNLAWTAVGEPAKIGDALRLVADAIDRHGPLDDLLDTRGRLLIAQGRFDEGIRDLLEAAEASPNATRFVQLAVVYRQRGMKREADDAMTVAKRFGLCPADVPPMDANAVRELTKK